MKIEHYSFATITIDGKSYTSDVIIYPERVDSSWWRKQGHSLHIVDLKDVIPAGPEILIVGTGHSGGMVVPDISNQRVLMFISHARIRLLSFLTSFRKIRKQ